jgi:hypothetical protein
MFMFMFGQQINCQTLCFLGKEKLFFYNFLNNLIVESLNF